MSSRSSKRGRHIQLKQIETQCYVLSFTDSFYFIGMSSLIIQQIKTVNEERCTQALFTLCDPNCLRCSLTVRKCNYDNTPMQYTVTFHS